MNLPDTYPFEGARPDLYQTLDSTKLQSYAACPRQYFLEYVLGWRLDKASNHLVFGRSWHSALEYLYQNGLSLDNIPAAYERFIQEYRKDWPESTDSWFGGKTPEAVLIGLVEYVEQNAEDLYKYEILATEVTDILPLNDLDSITVKLDAVMRDKATEKIVIMEHKTGSSSGAWWARQWHLSLQIGAYIAACNHFYNQEATPCIVDGTFFLKTKRTFQREIISKSETTMKNWAYTVLSLIKRIENDFAQLPFDHPNNDIQISFHQNPTACSNYGGCQFMDICTCVGNPISLAQSGQPPIGYKKFWWNPLGE